MLLRSIQLKNLLSFGPETTELQLGRLNILIGPNGVGKSNLIEGISLLQAAPRILTDPIVNEGGGIRDWLWKGSSKRADASLEAIIDLDALKTPMNLRYQLQFTEAGQRFQLTNERIENEKSQPGYAQPYLYYGYEEGRPVINIQSEKRFLRREDVHPELSILAQRKDPDTYPELTLLGELFAKIRIYRDWSFGRHTLPRLSQKPDLPKEFLDEDCRNLGLILNSLRREPKIKQRLLEALKLLYKEVDDFDVQIEGGYIQVFLQEGNFTVPATRLSDGTLRYLCLLAILCHPTPPPLICIEEPELGLHPDVIAKLGDLLREAAERTQLIITTHSDVLIDSLTNTPEVVIVCEKIDGSTVLQHLNQKNLAIWLAACRRGNVGRQEKCQASKFSRETI